jgi:hypothetical protein
VVWLARLASVAALVVATLACAGRPDVENPATFDQRGVRFDYPGNWALETDETGTVSVRGARSGLVTVVFSSTPLTVDGYAASLFGADGIYGSAQDLTLEPITRRVAGAQRDGVHATFSQSVIARQAAFGGELFVAPHGDGVVAVTTLSASEDQIAATLGFDLVLDTLAVE